MLTIGEFARFAGVSVRMLRHYDAVGLLAPTSVDPFTGYRRYDDSLLPRAHQLVALKQLGFTLEQVREALDGSAEDLRRLLEDRRRELAEQIDGDRARLDEVERRLRLTRGETMELTFTETDLPSLSVSQLSAEVAGQSEVGPTIGPLFGQLQSAAAEAGRPPEPGIAWYDMSEDSLRLGACGPAGLPGFEQATLDAHPRALVTTYTGPLVRIAEAWQAVGAQLAAEGLDPVGVCREIYHRTVPEDPTADWVVELQQPVG